MKVRLENINYRSYIEICLWSVVAVVFFLIILMASVPPVSRDALVHHLAIPKLYLNAGKVYEIPHLVFSYYPMNLEILYGIPLYLGNDIFPKYIHFMFAVLTCWLIFEYINRKIGRIYALLGVLLFISLPIIVKLSVTAYVDLGLVFFSFASVLSVIKWLESGFNRKKLIISAIWCGLAMGTKYNGLIVFFLLSMFIPFLYSRYSDTNNSWKAIKEAGLFIIIALLVFSPWMIKNYLWTGNPIYPLYGTIFNQSAEGTPGINHFVSRHYNYVEEWWEIILIPVRIFFQGEDNNPKFFDGRMNPLLFFLPIFAFVKSRGKQKFPLPEHYLLLFFSVLYVMIVFFQADMRIRYVSPIIPPLVILSMYGFHDIVLFVQNISNSTLRKWSIGTLSVGFILLLSFNGLYIYNLFGRIDPVLYITGNISKDQYIEKYCKEYPAIQYANNNLPEDANILSLFLGDRGYYSNRKMIFDQNILLNKIYAEKSPSDIAKAFFEQGITHFLIRYDLFNRWMNDNFDKQSLLLYSAFFKEYTELLYNKNGYILLQLNVPN